MNFFSGILAKMVVKRKGKNNGSNTIIYPFGDLIAAAIECFGFLFVYLFLLAIGLFSPAAIAENDENTILQLTIIFVPFIIFSFVFLLYLIRFKVTVNEDNFVYINLFKKTKTYYFKDVYITPVVQTHRCYLGDKLVVKISLRLDNAELLYDKIKAYQKENGIKPKNQKTGEIKRTVIWIAFSVIYFALSAIINAVSYFYVDWWKWTLLCHAPNLIFIVYNILWKVTFDYGTMTKRSLFGLKRYNLNELRFTISKNTAFYKIYRGKKLVAVVFAVEYNSDLVEKNVKYAV